MSSPSNVQSMAVCFVLLAISLDGFDLLGSLPQAGESWNKELKKRLIRTTPRLHTLHLSLINLPGQCKAVTDEDEDDEEMPHLVSSS